MRRHATAFPTLAGHARTALTGSILSALIVVLGCSVLPMTNAEAAGSGGGGLSRKERPKVDPAEAYQEGLELLQKGEYRAAADQFEAGLQVTPEDADMNYAMGLAQIGRDRLRRARRYLARAVEARADFVRARAKLGAVEAERGRMEEARAEIEALRTMMKECADACTDDLRESIEAAILAIETVIDGRSEPTADDDTLFQDRADTGDQRYRAAVGLINEGRYGDAIVALQATAGVVGPHADILNYLGFAHRKLGRFEEARTYYDQALAIDPDHKGANEYLGELFWELGDEAAARRQLATLDRLCPFGCPEREDLARLLQAGEKGQRQAGLMTGSAQPVAR